MFTLRVFGRVLQSTPERAHAHFVREEATLYYVVHNTDLPWNAIARELATILGNETEPGQVALTIKEVLTAATLESAKIVLDELGFSILDTSVQEQTMIPSVVED